MVDCYLEAAECDSATDQQKAALKSKAQSVYCYFKDALDAPKQVGSQRSYTLILHFERLHSVIVKHFHERS